MKRKKIIKRITTLLLSASVMIGSVGIAKASENPYADVFESDWYYNSVLYVKEKGVMTGVDPAHFDPGAYLQRQDFALALMRDYIRRGYTVTQQDDGTYYGKAVAWAKENRIMTGYSNGDFGVGDVITRQDSVVTLERYKDAVGIISGSPIEDPDYEIKMEQFKTTYADVDQLRDYSFDDMYMAVMNYELIKGIEKDGRLFLDPNGLTTRGTASVMLERWLTGIDKLMGM